MKKILFVDRDGTLIEEPPDEQIDSLAKLALLPHVVPSLLALLAHGYRLVMITNQDGLGTASFPTEDFEPAHRKMLDLFASQGIRFDDVLICPHLPGDGCTCRKPHLGLVRPYLTDANVDREKSAVIGDRSSDLDLASNMGIRGLRVGPEGHDWPALVELLTALPRTAQVSRTTKETQIEISVNLDGQGQSTIDTGIGFFDHMLEQISRHGGLDLQVAVQGDLHVDAHHTVEDTALALGEALRRALGDKVGIARYGFLLPMDEALARVALDLSGRPFLTFDAVWPAPRVGGLDTELVPHFFSSLSQTLGCTLNIHITGENTHHMVEATFKGFARALGQAIEKSGQGLPSTKGTL